MHGGRKKVNAQKNNLFSNSYFPFLLNTQMKGANDNLC